MLLHPLFKVYSVVGSTLGEVVGSQTGCIVQAPLGQKWLLAWLLAWLLGLGGHLRGY